MSPGDLAWAGLIFMPGIVAAAWLSVMIYKELRQPEERLQDAPHHEFAHWSPYSQEACEIACQESLRRSRERRMRA